MDEKMKRSLKIVLGLLNERTKYAKAVDLLIESPGDYSPQEYYGTLFTALYDGLYELELEIKKITGEYNPVFKKRANAITEKGDL